MPCKILRNGWAWARPVAYAWSLALLVGLADSTPSNAQDDRAALRRFLNESINQASSFEDRFDAEVWLIDMQTRLLPFMPDDAMGVEFLTTLHREATAADLPPELVLAVIEVESHFDRFAISRVGAQGYMQVMSFWREEIGRAGDNLTDMLTNLRYGCRILQFYLNREQGDLETALAAYNGSSGSRVYSDKVRIAWENHWKIDDLPW
jgi:membrane-bound lytic murein transglycosylase MltF